MSEKTQILSEVSPLIAPRETMGIRFLATVALTLILVMLMLFPKIFLQSRIYYKSREIAQQEREFDALREENRLIRTKVESIRFKNQILDTLFLIQ